MERKTVLINTSNPDLWTCAKMAGHTISKLITYRGQLHAIFDGKKMPTVEIRAYLNTRYQYVNIHTGLAWPKI